MPAMLHLVRHGEVHNPDHLVYARLAGFGLSDLGHTQASQAAAYLAPRPIVAVWSSPLQRALETAQAIAGAASVPVRVHPDLTEWKLADSWAGIAWDDLPAERPGQLERYLEKPWDLDFASESLDQLAARIATTVEALAARHPEGDVVAVSHQDPVQAGRLRMTGRSLQELAVDKPGHATVLSFRRADEWDEVARWDAPESAPFPPRAP